LDEFLEMNGIPGIERVDTRALTKKIRTQGVMLGILEVYSKGEEPNLRELKREAQSMEDPRNRDLVGEVCAKEIKRHPGREDCQVVLIDCGVKNSILRNFTSRGVTVVQVPPNTSSDQIAKLKPDGVVLSNGPGDPKRVKDAIRTVKSLIELHVPFFGVCLGAQILALALGGDTFKLKFGHRGQNHPCLELRTGRCYISCQNHGYAIDPDSLFETGLEVTYVNANDRTVEAIEHRILPVFATQWHPEGSPGPNDTNFMFDKFMAMMKDAKKMVR
jgi:carbamoyl-phosphate synthase small subunit